MSQGKRLRMARLSRSGGDRFLFVPMDHSLTDGSIATAPRFRQIVAEIAGAGADALIVHKGRARAVAEVPLGSTALIVHLSASTNHAADPNAKVLVGDVEDAVRLGADAVSVHVNIGSLTEREQLVDFGTVASACERFGMPLLAMVYPRGPQITDPYDPTLIAHAVSIAVDIGADIVKTNVPRPLDELATVVAGSPVPVVCAGGFAGGALIDLATGIIRAGGAGMAVGRRVWGDPDPGAVVRELVKVIHPDPSPLVPYDSSALTALTGATK
ncbi:2-amino-3,7-dideoxy-D-threo-hept-6-ulosonate synthase [Actinokineospora sp.]|uniref:2-amino-3,7-dideoxy-D-threo-hept-6-ulosonate synthase n=1 Tax=Actinokineospora sp. TaxID=1872133 RepID=UPI0040382682